MELAQNAQSVTGLPFIGSELSLMMEELLLIPRPNTGAIQNISLLVKVRYLNAGTSWLLISTLVIKSILSAHHTTLMVLHISHLLYPTISSL